VSECSHRIAAHAGQGSMATAKRLVVVGGSGYVGSHIMRAALARGASVASVSRRGKPVASVSPPLDRAEWISADVQDSAALQNAMKGADAVISCLGAFGSNEFMRRVNGEQNEKIISAAAAGGVERFVYISAAPFGPIEKLIPGYFEGKRAAEAAVSKHFGDRGTVIQPGMVYGTRHVSKHVSIPLGIIGWPMSIFFQSSPVRGLANTLGRWGLLLVPPSSVEEVASTAVAAALGTNAENGGNSGAGGSQNAGQSGSAVALGWERIKQIAHSVEMSSVPAVTLFWDGGCPLCRREIGFYQRLDTKKRVRCPTRSPLLLLCLPSHLYQKSAKARYEFYFMT